MTLRSEDVNYYIKKCDYYNDNIRVSDYGNGLGFARTDRETDDMCKNLNKRLMLHNPLISRQNYLQIQRNRRPLEFFEDNNKNIIKNEILLIIIICILIYYLL